jgi:hydrogenase maturation protein HypF
VLQLSARHRQPIWLRRSRGLAPTYSGPVPKLNTASLAMGAQMKAAFGLWHEGNVYLSQYLGELSSYDTQLAFQHSLRHFLSVMDARPQRIIIDSHPDYFASRWGRELAQEWDIPLQEVQHHEAHFAAVLAENNWLQSPEPVLGIIWDGLGWGTDQQIWGGECFRFAGGSMRRVDHLAYYPHLAGDKMNREPRLAALAMGHAEPEVTAMLEARFSEVEWRVYQQLLAKPARLQSASLGRLFDAVACLLDLGDRDLLRRRGGHAARAAGSSGRGRRQAAPVSLAAGEVFGGSLAEAGSPTAADGRRPGGPCPGISPGPGGGRCPLGRGL